MMRAADVYIGLNMIPNLGAVRIDAAVDMFGDPRTAWEADAGAWARVPGIGPRLAGRIVASRAAIDPARERHKAESAGFAIITRADRDYPPQLAQIHDPPPVLYVRGTLCKEDRHSLALVGSRRCTHYGRGVADRLAFELVRVGYTVVSGLARGIDGAAHRGALKGGGRTLAVLGSALDKIYPPEHDELASEIAACGALISELPMGREPDRTTFPYRNRIISGLSQGVVVVEASAASGAMRTAGDAAEQGRSVFAVPGRIDSPGSRGCHQLLRDGARLVEGLDDILEEFELLLPPSVEEMRQSVVRRPQVPLDAAESMLVASLRKGGLDIDSLSREAGLPVSRVSGLLVGLEIKRVVHMLPGRRVELAPGYANELV